MSFLSLLLSHLLAAYAAFVEPVLGVRLYGDLERKASRDPQAHVRFYRLGLATEWSWVLAVGLIVFFGGPSLSKLGLRFEVPPAEILGFVAAVVFGGLVPVVALWLRRLRSGEPPALAWDGVFHVRTQIAWHGERWRSPALRAFLDPPVRSSARRPAGFLRPDRTSLAHTACQKRGAQTWSRRPACQAASAYPEAWYQKTGVFRCHPRRDREDAFRAAF